MNPDPDTKFYQNVGFGTFLIFVILIAIIIILIEPVGVLRAELLIIFTATSVFPISALAYQLFKRKTRIRRLGRDFWLLGIDIREKYPSNKISINNKPEEAIDNWSIEAYTNYVEQAYNLKYSRMNWAIQAALAGLVTILGASLFFWEPSSTDEIINVNTVQALRYGFLGAYIFSLQLIYRRYSTLDLRPNVFFYCTVTMITGIAFNLVVFTAVDIISGQPVPGGYGQDNQIATGLEGAILAITAFSLGYFPYLAIRWFNRVAYSRLGMPQHRANELSLRLIDGISELHETRLRDEGVDNMQNLAAVALDEMLLSTNFSAQELVEWVDQAILYLYLELGEIEIFRRAGARGITDFIDQWEPFHSQKIKEKLEDLANTLHDVEWENITNGKLKVNSIDIDKLKSYRDNILITLENDKKEKALQFQSLPDRLDALYHAIQQGPNSAHIRSYWRRAINLQDHIQKHMDHEMEEAIDKLKNLERKYTEITERYWDYFMRLPLEQRRDALSDLEYKDDLEFEDKLGNEQVNPIVLEARGWIASEEKDFGKAIEFYEKVLDLDPDCSRAQDGLAAAKKAKKGLQESKPYQIVKPKKVAPEIAAETKKRAKEALDETQEVNETAEVVEENSETADADASFEEENVGTTTSES